MLIVYKKYPINSCALQMMANYEVVPAAILFFNTVKPLG